MISKNKVWLLVLLVLLVISVPTKQESIATRHISTFLENLWNTTRQTLVQGVPDTSLRHVFPVLLLFMLIVFQTAYRGFVSSVLTLTEKHPNVDNLQDLANAVRSGDIRQIYLTKAVDRNLRKPEHVKRLGKALQIAFSVFKPVNLLDLSETIRYFDQSTAFIFSYAAAVGFCETNFYASSETIQTATPSIILVKGFPQIEDFKSMVHYLVESGLLSKWNEDCFTCQTILRDPEIIEPVTLKLKFFLNTFYMLAVGLVFASISFLCEVIVDKICKIKVARKLEAVNRRRVLIEIIDITMGISYRPRQPRIVLVDLNNLSQEPCV